MSQLMMIFLAAALTAIVAMIGWLLRRVARYGEDLAVIRQQLTPAGEKPLHARVDDNDRRITVIETRLNLKAGIAQ